MLPPRKQCGGFTVVSAVTFLVLGGLYLLFAGSVGADECVAAVATAALGTAWLWLHARRTDRALRLTRAPWWRLILRPLLQLFSDSVRVGVVLLRAVAGSRPSGSLQWQGLWHGGMTPRAAGRRGAVTLALSFAPNGIVLDLPGEADAALLHRLSSASPQPDRAWPV